MQHEHNSPTASINTFFQAIIRKDVERIIASYMHSPETYVFVEGPRYSTLGVDDIQKGWRDFCASAIVIESITWTEGPFEHSCEQMARVAGIVKIRVNIRGKSFENTFRMTFVLVQQEQGHWRIEHEHASAPLPDPYGIGDWLTKNS